MTLCLLPQIRRWPRGASIPSPLRLIAWLFALAGVSASAAQALTVVGLGGAYGRASKAAVMDPFARDTGINVRMDDYNGGLSQIRAQVEAGQIFWDVVDLEISELGRACDEGLLVPIDITTLPPATDGSPAQGDFVPGTVTDCGVSQVLYSTAVAYNRDYYQGDEVPTTIKDFFDLAKFPGRRGMRRRPEFNLEFALMADGVPPDDVYATLSAPEGVNRAFRKLDTIKETVIWWEAGAQPPQMLADMEVAMTIAYNGRIFNAQVMEKQPLVMVWDGQILDSNGFAIVAGTPNLEAAMRFVRYAAEPATQARVSRYISYGPTRHSAAPLISTHLATGVAMEPHMPTSPQNLRRSLQNNWRWWTDYSDELNERFSFWLRR